MKFLGLELRRASRAAERRDSIENPMIPVSADNFLRYFGVNTVDLPAITIDSALTDPAVFAAVAFLSRTLAALPLHPFRKAGESAARIAGPLAEMVNANVNPEWTSFGARQYFWQQVFLTGRGLFWIERSVSGQPAALWPINAARATVSIRLGSRFYRMDGIEYPAADIIDLPFMLRSDQCSVYSPISRCAGAIQLSLAMRTYAARFFAGGGVPPLALTGPMPTDKAGMQRAMGDIWRAIEAAREADKPMFPMPPGHDLKAIGIDPDKGQMTEGRRLQVEEIARAFQLPPVFLQDLSKGTFSNTEQQDLFFVKHLVSQWAKAFEQELNLKLFGMNGGRRYVEHNLDALMRGDFRSRVEGLARSIQTGQLMPDEARALEGRPPDPSGAGAKLYIQGATVPLGTVQATPVTDPKTDPNNDPSGDDNEQSGNSDDSGST